MSRNPTPTPTPRHDAPAPADDRTPAAPPRRKTHRRREITPDCMQRTQDAPALQPDALQPRPGDAAVLPAHQAAAAALDVPARYLAMLDVDDAGDLANVPEAIRARALALLAIWQDGAYYDDAQRLANTETWEITVAEKRSATYRELWHHVHRQRMQRAAARVEAVVERCATGDCRTREGYLPPDGRAQQLILQAHDEAYDPKQAAALPQVNIQINF